MNENIVKELRVLRQSGKWEKMREDSGDGCATETQKGIVDFKSWLENSLVCETGEESWDHFEHLHYHKPFFRESRKIVGYLFHFNLLWMTPTVQDVQAKTQNFLWLILATFLFVLAF